MSMNSFIFALLCLCLLFGLTKILTKRNQKSPANLPPGPRPLPVVGNLFDLGSDPFNSMAELAATYGPIMSLKLGQVPTTVISSKSLAKEIYQTHDMSFFNRNVPDVMSAHRQDERGLPWMPLSPLWKNLRRICNLHVFMAKKLDANQGLRREKIHEMIQHIKKYVAEGEPVDIGEAIFTTNLSSLANTVFSIDFACQSSDSARLFNETVREMIDDVMKPNIVDCFHVLRRFDPQGCRRRMTTYFGRLLDIFDDLIEKRVRRRQTPDYTATNDVLDTLLDICEDKSDGIDVTQVKHLFLDFFVAGVHTTASTAEAAMVELLRNPDILSNAKAELESIVGKGHPIEESNISQLPYLQAIIKESLRLHPPSDLLPPRKPDCDIAIGGYTIPQDSQVLIHIGVIGRDPSIWAKPDEFMPERFWDSEIDIKGQNFELITFGSGRRICPGLPLAFRMMHLMVGTLVNCFNWRLEDGIGHKNMRFSRPIKAMAMLPYD